MNLDTILEDMNKTVTTQNLLRDKGVATIIKIRKEGILKEHESMTNALLILLSGAAIYQEHDRTVALSQPHDFVRIPAKVTHRLTGTDDALLLLIQ